MYGRTLGRQSLSHHIHSRNTSLDYSVKEVLDMIRGSKIFFKCKRGTSSFYKGAFYYNIKAVLGERYVLYMELDKTKFMSLLQFV